MMANGMKCSEGEYCEFDNPFLEDDENCSSNRIKVASVLTFETPMHEFFLTIVKAWTKTDYAITWRKMRDGDIILTQQLTKIQTIVMVRALANTTLLQAKQSVDKLD